MNIFYFYQEQLGERGENTLFFPPSFYHKKMFKKKTISCFYHSSKHIYIFYIKTQYNLLIHTDIGIFECIPNMGYTCNYLILSSIIFCYHYHIMFCFGFYLNTFTVW